MKPFDYVLYGLVVFSWSTSWLPLKWQLGEVAPEISLLWRFVIAAAVMFAIAAISSQSLRIPWRQHLRIMPMGVCLFSMNFTFLYYGGIGATSGLLAVIFSTASLINVFLVALLSRTWPKMTIVFAGVIGFVGVGLLYSPELSGSENGLRSLIFCLIGTCFFCTGNIISSANQKLGIPILTANCWGMFYGVIILTIVSLVRGHDFIISDEPRYLGGLLWLALISSVVAFSSYLKLLGRIGPGKAGYATVIFPVGALLISTVMEGFQWDLVVFAGLVLVLLGNVIMIRSR